MTITSDDLSWMFHDTDWKNKFLVGSLLALAGTTVPLLGLAALVILYGYALVLMRASLLGEPRTLPRWENFGELFVNGLKGILSALGYFAPSIILFLCGFGLFIIGIFGGVFGAAGTNNSRNPNGFFPILFLSAYFSFLACLMFAIFVGYIGFAFTPLALGQYLRTGKISAGYHWSEVWSILRANIAGFFLAWAIYIGIGVVTTIVTMFFYITIILCFLYPLLLAPITFYVNLVFAQFFGMAYREGARKTGLLSAPMEQRP